VVDLANALWRSGAAYYRRRFGVGMVEVRLLLALARAGRALTAAETAFAARLDKAATSRGLRALAAAGHVVLAADPRGRRRIAVRLTASGHRLARGSAEAAAERQARLLAGMPEDEAAMLAAALRRLLDRLPQLRSDTAPGR
jgi:DNA-binding MarR family transcriptional regulator